MLAFSLAAAGLAPGPLYHITSPLERWAIPYPRGHLPRLRHHSSRHTVPSVSPLLGSSCATQYDGALPPVSRPRSCRSRGTATGPGRTASARWLPATSSGALEGEPLTLGESPPTRTVAKRRAIPQVGRQTALGRCPEWPTPRTGLPPRAVAQGRPTPPSVWGGLAVWSLRGTVPSRAARNARFRRPGTRERPCHRAPSPSTCTAAQAAVVLLPPFTLAARTRRRASRRQTQRTPPGAPTPPAAPSATAAARGAPAARRAPQTG